MPDKPAGRANLHAFFQFDEIIERPGFAGLLFFFQLGLMVYGVNRALDWERPGRENVFGLVYMDAALIGLAIMAVCAFGIFLLLSLYKLVTRIRRTRRRHLLEHQARDVLRKDYKRALRAILKASGLRPSELRTVRTAGAPELEKLLFDDGDLSAFLGPIEKQSFRAVTPYGQDVAFAPVGKDRLDGQHHFEGFFTPFYVVCLFLTKTHYVVGEAVCNSMTGHLQRRVRRIPKAQIAAAEFRTNTRTMPLPERMLDEWLENRRVDGKETRQISELLQRHERSSRHARRYGQAQPVLPYNIVQNSRFLEITLRDGSSLQLTTRLEQTIVRSDGVSPHRHQDIFEQEDYTTAWNDITFRTRSFNPYTRGYLDDPQETGNVTEKRELWSSGRQASNRAFLAFPNFFLTLLTALFMAIAVLWLMNTLTTDTSQRRSSSIMSGYRMQTPEGIVSLIPDPLSLSEPLQVRLRNQPDARFACTTQTSTLREMASSRAASLANLDAAMPVIVLPQTQAAPAGWSEVIVSLNEAEIQGYLPSVILDNRTGSTQLNCVR